MDIELIKPYFTEINDWAILESDVENIKFGLLNLNQTIDILKSKVQNYDIEPLLSESEMSLENVAGHIGLENSSVDEAQGTSESEPLISNKVILRKL